MEPPLIQLILGSTRQGRRGDRVAAWFAAIAGARSDMRCELLDLREWALPWFDDPKFPARGEYGDPAVRRWAATIARGDGYVFVTPEYNHGYPAPLKNALDSIYLEWNRKPVTFVTYGGSGGGVRAAELLVPVAVELELVPLRRQVHITGVGRIFGSSGTGVVEERHAEAATAALDDLVWWARTLRAARTR